MFWRELKQFACILSQYHRKLSEHGMSIYPLSAANTRRSTDAGLMLVQHLRRYTNINQALMQITAVFVACLVVICYNYIGLSGVTSQAYLGSRRTISG